MAAKTNSKYAGMTRADIIAQHEQFRKDVVDAATDAARENGWCEAVDDVLRDLDLDDLMPKRIRRVTLVVDVELADGDERPEDDEDWAALALERIRYDRMGAGDLTNYSTAEAPE